MLQFLKNIGAMLYVAFILCLIGGLISQVFAFGVALSTGWLIAMAIFFGTTIIGLFFGLAGLAAGPATYWIKGTISGKIMCTFAGVFAIGYNVFSITKMVKEFNEMNASGHTTFLVLQIIAGLIVVIGSVACLGAIWASTEE